MIQHKKDANYKFLFEKKKARIESLQIKLEAMRILYTLKEREERNKTKKELKQEKQNMLQLLKHIDLCTTMKISDFLPFIISYLSSIEKKDIIAFPITQDYELEEGKSLTDKVVSRIYNYVKQKFLIKDLLIDVNETFYLICSREEAEKIKEMTKICSLYDALEKMKLREYLLIPMDFQEIHLADGIELKKNGELVRKCLLYLIIF